MSRARYDCEKCTFANYPPMPTADSAPYQCVECDDMMLYPVTCKECKRTFYNSTPKLEGVSTCGFCAGKKPPVSVMCQSCYKMRTTVYYGICTPCNGTKAFFGEMFNHSTNDRQFVKDARVNGKVTGKWSVDTYRTYVLQLVYRLTVTSGAGYDSDPEVTHTSKKVVYYPLVRVFEDRHVSSSDGRVSLDDAVLHRYYPQSILKWDTRDKCVITDARVVPVSALIVLDPDAPAC